MVLKFYTDTYLVEWYTSFCFNANVKAGEWFRYNVRIQSKRKHSRFGVQVGFYVLPTQ